MTALGLGVLGILLRLLPTVPFVLLAPFFFAPSSPRLEGRLVGERPGAAPTKITRWCRFSVS